VVRDEFGNLARVVLPYVNIANARTEALDLDAAARRTTRWGDVALRLRASRLLRQERQALPSLPTEDLLGINGGPRWRAGISLDWERNAHGASLGAEHIDGYAFCDQLEVVANPSDPQCVGRVASHTEFNAQWRWRAPWNGEFALGARNLANRPPAFDPVGGYAYGLYDPNGRVWYLSYRQQF
jgi:hypothetical protein